MKLKPFVHLFAVCGATLLATSSGLFGQAATQFTWSGTASSDWTTGGAGGNWNNGAAPGQNTTIAARINVGNATVQVPTRALEYTAAQGTTIFQSTDRSLVIGNGAGANGTMRITGGVFDSRGNGRDAVANAGGSGTLIIDGGTYTNVNGGNTEFSVLLNGGGTATLTINSGNFIVGTITFGEGTANTAGNAVINLNGGFMEVGNFTESTNKIATSTINFNGGVLRARQDNTNYFGVSGVVDNARVLNGGAIFDTNGFNVAVNNALVQHSGSTGGLTKQGGGILTLSGTNTYIGATQVTGGTLRAGAAAGGQAFGNGSAVTLANTSGVVLDLNGFNQSIGSLAGGGASGGNVILGAGTLTAGGNNSSTSFAGEISGTGGLTKTGSGKLTLTGANAYTGATSVSGGVLAVNGTLANTSTTIGNGATLQGSGSMGGSVTVQGGGTLAAGNSIESLGTGTLNLASGSTFAYEIDKSVALGVGGDLTYVTGDLNITTGAILTLVELNTLVSGSWAIGEKLTLISYTGIWNDGLFTYDGGTLADGDTFSFSGAMWSLDYNDAFAGSNYFGDIPEAPPISSFVTMTVIPEPGCVLLGALGTLLLLRRRRS